MQIGQVGISFCKDPSVTSHFFVSGIEFPKPTTVAIPEAPEHWIFTTTWVNPTCLRVDVNWDGEACNLTNYSISEIVVTVTDDSNGENTASDKIPVCIFGGVVPK